MIKEIVGVRLYSFPDSKTGELIEGANVHLQWRQDDTEGICCESGNVSSKILLSYVPEIGDKVVIGKNKYGKIDTIVKVG